MKEGADFHSPPPPDDPHDPLLAALRKHLGENFGQEPPAALWAGIRQQLPGTPRPWWRSRRLLPLLALLIGIVALGVFSARQNGWLGGHAATELAANKTTIGTHSQESTASNKAKTIASQPANERATSGSPTTAAVPSTPAQPHTTLGPQPKPDLAAAPQASSSRSGARKAAGIIASTGELPLTPMREQATEHAGNVATATEPSYRARHLAALQRKWQHNGTPSQHRASSLAARPLEKTLDTPTQASATSAATEQSIYSPANGVANSGGARKRNRRRAVQTATQLARAVATDAGTNNNADPELQSAAMANSRSQRAASSVAGPDVATTNQPEALDSLASRRATLLLAARNLPAVLASTADTSKPWFLPTQRWSVLVLAGPTLSFRTVRSATTGGLSYSSPLVNSPSQSFNGTRTTSPNVVDLERPAAGWNAQVQVRRVLTGRWAVALGVGYQEYATRLALQVRKRAIQTTSPASGVSYLDSTLSVHHRDTYQLLTLPLQLSYTLGPPRGRLSLSVLGGLEPSWYVGGRTTEGTSCNCEQQSFSSASGSPYNTFNLGLSLGLDARYRLGGPASRWQWVLQPTGHYVASPFVRSSTLYARRQPYSLGLLTGLAWEF